MGDAMTQEYPATIDEALEVPGGAFFPEVNAKNTISTQFLDEDENGKARNVVKYVTIDYGLDMFSAHWIMVDGQNNAQVYREYDAPNKTASEAAGILSEMCKNEKIHLFLAPRDLWSRDRHTGKSTATIFEENGIYLTKSNSDRFHGCNAMKEWLRPRGEKKSRLTILEGTAPNLYNCLKKIQKDKKKVTVYAVDPHDLTHDVDSLRYFCIYWTIAADKTVEEHKRQFWTEDMIEDYLNANDEDRAYMEAKYGVPMI